LFPPLILASTSRYRRALLERLGVPFECISPGVEETHLPGEPPAARAQRLALAKARAVHATHPRSVVIGSDQVAAAGREILDKPGDAVRNRAQLAALSGTVARFHTACAVLKPANAANTGESGLKLLHLDTTTVHFRPLTAAEIERYVEREQPYDCAGGFKVEAGGIALFSRIESTDPTALVGLPLIWVAEALRRAGYPIP
jgi:septum formation protein